MSVKEYFNYAFSKVAELSEEDKVRAQYIKDHLPQDAREVLDVGCGEGTVTCRIAEFCSVKGVELSDVGVRRLRERGLECVQGDISQIPHPDRSFDLVMTCEVLEHLNEALYPRALQELQRVTKRYVLITVPNRDCLPALRQECPKCRSVTVPWGHIRSFDQERLRGLLPGFEVLLVEEFGHLVPNLNSLAARILGLPRRLDRQLRRDNRCPICEYEETSRKDGRPTIGAALAHPVAAVAYTSAFLVSRLAPKYPRWLLALYRRTESA